MEQDKLVLLRQVGERLHGVRCKPHLPWISAYRIERSDIGSRARAPFLMILVIA